MAKRKIFWTDEKKAKLSELYPFHRNRDLAKMLGVSAGAINVQACLLKLRKDKACMREWSREGAFPKGHVPFNKGECMKNYLSHEALIRMQATQFKKGNIPRNHKEVGFERVTKDGYVEIKIAEPDVFELKHRYVWAKANGHIPPHHIVTFKDGNRRNFDLSNLELVSRRDHIMKVGVHAYPAEYQRLVHTSSVLQRIIHKKEKK